MWFFDVNRARFNADRGKNARPTVSDYRYVSSVYRRTIVPSKLIPEKFMCAFNEFPGYTISLLRHRNKPTLSRH